MGKKVKYGVGIIIMLVLIILYSFVDKKYPVYDEEIPIEEYVLSEELTDGDSISQTFCAETESIRAVSLKCTVNGDASSGVFLYTLYDESGNKAGTGQIALSELKSGKFNMFEFDTIENCQGKDYTFEAKVENAGESSISLYQTVSTEENTTMEQNGVKTEGTLVMREVTHVFDWETFVVVFCFAIYIIVFIKMLYKFFS